MCVFLLIFFILLGVLIIDLSTPLNALILLCAFSFHISDLVSTCNVYKATSNDGLTASIKYDT